MIVATIVISIGLLLGFYGAVGYRYGGLPLPIATRHERCLANTERLEYELGYREDVDQEAEAERAYNDRHYVQLYGNPYSFAWSTDQKAIDNVDVNDIPPKDRNPHQQDYA